jgi:uncharacterized protein YndB with AHSA1/START domain
MRIVKFALYTLLGLLALALITALFVKKEYSITREVTISKPRQEVFSYIKLLKNQNEYSVWSKIDPTMKTEFRGTDGTVGFVFAWDSPVEEAGKGEQEILKITENERIDYELRFLAPMESKDHIYMSTQSLTDSSTVVRWGFDGKMKYPMNLTLLFLDLDQLVGKDLEKGLSNLKEILEKQ